MTDLRQRIEAAASGSLGESPNADVPRPKRFVRLTFIGQAGVRDPDHPCEGFTPGEPRGDCQTDGHYMCHECEHCQRCEACEQIEDRCECPDPYVNALARAIEAIAASAPDELPNTLLVPVEAFEPRKPSRPSPEDRPLARLVETEQMLTHRKQRF